MPENEEFKHLVRRTALATFSFAAGLAFGIILLVVDNDWIPGSIIAGASLSPSPPRQEPAH